MESTTKKTESAVADLDQIMYELSAPWSDVLPRNAIRAAQYHRELIIPRLIQSIEDATAQMISGEIPEQNAHFYALFLLTEFRAKEALPAIIESISLPGEAPFDLYGDAITEALNRILAALVLNQACLD